MCHSVLQKHVIHKNLNVKFNTYKNNVTKFYVFSSLFVSECQCYVNK